MLTLLLYTGEQQVRATADQFQTLDQLKNVPSEATFKGTQRNAFAPLLKQMCVICIGIRTQFCFGGGVTNLAEYFI